MFPFEHAPMTSGVAPLVSLCPPRISESPLRASAARAMVLRGAGRLARSRAGQVRVSDEQRRSAQVLIAASLRPIGIACGELREPGASFRTGGARFRALHQHFRALQYHVRLRRADPRAR